ncbi:MAG: sulfite exporter TauE/SafE family protein [Candidatus Freyarchaeota archaeon]|nr:sulfite exporter TauE/SafE family protein [Candidatus Freyrarchaeum guaymaensis]
MDLLIAVILLVIAGLAVGFANGFFGVGGCFLMIPVMYYIFVSLGVPSDLAIKLAFGTNMAVVVPTAIMGLWSHKKEKGEFIHVGEWKDLIAGATVGSAIGSVCAFLAPGELLKFLFGLFCIIGAYRFMTGKPKPIEEMPREHSTLKALIGGAAGGGTAQFLGIGGGLVYLIILNMLLDMPIHGAVAMSLATMIFGSGVGATIFAILGSTLPWTVAYLPDPLGVLIPRLSLQWTLSMLNSVIPGISTLYWLDVLLTSTNPILHHVLKIGSVLGVVPIVNQLNPVKIAPPFSIGFVNLLAFAALAVTSIPLSRAGAWAAHKVSPRRLAILLAIVYIYVGLKLMGIFSLLGLPI